MVRATILLIIVSVWGCTGQSNSSWSDKRDGRVYQYEAVDGLYWLTSNFNYLDRSFYCKGAWVFSYEEGEFEDALLRIRKSDSGVLYNYQTANRLNTDGWRLPSVEEWKKILVKGETGINPCLGDYDLILDGRARSYDRFCIYSGVTFWTSEMASSDGDDPKATVVVINISDEGRLITRFEEQSTSHAFFVRYVRDKNRNSKNTQY